MKLTLLVRVAFARGLFELNEPDEGKPKYQCKGLLAPTDPQIKLIENAINKVATEKWADKAPLILKAMRAQDKTCLHDGDNKPEWDGFPGMKYVNASAEKRPTVKDIDGVTPLTLSDGKIYSGCYIKLLIELWAQDNKHGKRVNASLRGAQFVRDGDAFAGAGAAPASDEEFEDMSVGSAAMDDV